MVWSPSRSLLIAMKVFPSSIRFWPSPWPTPVSSPLLTEPPLLTASSLVESWSATFFEASTLSLVLSRCHGKIPSESRWWRDYLVLYPSNVFSLWLLIQWRFCAGDVNVVCALTDVRMNSNIIPCYYIKVSPTSVWGRYIPFNIMTSQKRQKISKSISRWQKIIIHHPYIIHRLTHISHHPSSINDAIKSDCYKKRSTLTINNTSMNASLTFNTST